MKSEEINKVSRYSFSSLQDVLERAMSRRVQLGKANSGYVLEYAEL
jgi:hypothetical protein